MTRTKTLTSAAVLVAATLLLAGCGGQDDTAEPAASGDATASQPASPSASASAPAAEESSSTTTITGTGYTFSVPEGWAEPAQDMTGGQADVLVMQNGGDGASNVTVVLSPMMLTPADVEAQGPAGLESLGASSVETKDRVQIGGSESAHLSATLSQSGIEATVDQYYATQGDQTYVITVTTTSETPEADRQALSDTVLSTWAWS